MMTQEEMQKKSEELKKRKDEFDEAMYHLECIKTSHRVLSLRSGGVKIVDLPKDTMPSCNVNPREHGVYYTIQGAMIDAGIRKAEDEIERILKEAEEVLMQGGE